MKLSSSLLLLSLCPTWTASFTASPPPFARPSTISSNPAIGITSPHNFPPAPIISTDTALFESASPTATATEGTSLEKNVRTLKRVLEREYISFFDPMKTEYYEEDVSFEDPLTSLSGVAAYQGNVDMLSGRTLLGKILFTDAGINLHSVTGGDIDSNGKIGDINTRWTLRFTFQALPWKPTAVFSGISVYKVKETNDAEGVKIVGQKDYWDSVNIVPDSNGEYAAVDKGTALKDFLGQLDPNKDVAAAPSALGRELPYELLRRGDGYDVRRYPACAVARLPYDRRDEAYELLGAFTRGVSPLSPAIMEVSDGSTRDKYMNWPIAFAPPGTEKDAKDIIPPSSLEKAGVGGFKNVAVEIIPERTIAVATYSDASTEMAVRANDQILRKALRRDGLVGKGSDDGVSSVTFAQYDAIFSMGKRRGEVWIELVGENGGHPWV